MDSASYWECENILEEHWALEIMLRHLWKLLSAPESTQVLSVEEENKSLPMISPSLLPENPSDLNFQRTIFSFQ